MSRTTFNVLGVMFIILTVGEVVLSSFTVEGYKLDPISGARMNVPTPPPHPKKKVCLFFFLNKIARPTKRTQYHSAQIDDMKLQHHTTMNLTKTAQNASLYSSNPAQRISQEYKSPNQISYFYSELLQPRISPAQSTFWCYSTGAMQVG